MQTKREGNPEGGGGWFDRIQRGGIQGSGMGKYSENEEEYPEGQWGREGLI